jgi:hypothetical protein
VHGQHDEDDDDEKWFADLQRRTGKPPTPPRHGKARRKETFVKVPLWWFEQATRATKTQQAFVALWLLHLAWKASSTTFPLPNGKLAGHGAGRKAKARALASLEAAGLITVKRRPGKTPAVTLTVL